MTIGTLDGANVEIRERVGPENIFIFGLTADEVEGRKQRGYDPRSAIDQSPSLREVLDAVGSGVFSHDQPDRFRELIEAMYGHDQFLVTADFDSYAASQREVALLWHDRRAWWRASVLNTARTAWFSSDRTISEYASEIWNVPATPIAGR